MKRYFRRIRRNICRWIMGFDNCPSCYRSNPRRKIGNGLICIAIAIGVMIFFFMLLICL